MTEQEINPFDSSSYATDPSVTNDLSNGTELPQDSSSVESTPTESVNTEGNTESPSIDDNVSSDANYQNDSNIESESYYNVPQPEITFEWENEMAKEIYESLVSGNISDVADLMYEQKVLSEIDKLDESDILRLKIAYDYPDLTPQEIEEEFNSKYSVDKDFDESTMTDEEIAATRKRIEKQEKAIARELKKDVREAKDYLQTLKQDISFPDILSQFKESQTTVNTDEVVNQYLAAQQEEMSKVYEESRRMFENSIDDGLKNFEGFTVNYKDEDVHFDGKYALTQEEKAQLQGDLKSFDLEQFYGNRYYKDGKYDTKQLAEDVYFLQNRDKIVNSMVTQAVSKAKADMLRGIKNIDYSNSPRPAAAVDMSDYDKMVSSMFNL
jgi:hypothetical protein